MSATSSVYCLVDGSGAPVYVGQTQYGVAERAYEHWVCRNSASMRRSNSQLADWLGTLDCAPDYVVLDRVLLSERLAVEGYYIRCFLWAGAPLLNKDQGHHASRTVQLMVAPAWRDRYTPITWRGVTMTAKGWYETLGMSPGKFYYRIARWPLRDVLTRGVDPALLEAIGPDSDDPVMTRN